MEGWTAAQCGLASSTCSAAPLTPPAPFFSVFFFFQAEDGIRDVAVTGVQTCALPILGLMDHLSLSLIPCLILKQLTHIFLLLFYFFSNPTSSAKKFGSIHFMEIIIILHEHHTEKKRR